MLLDISTLYLLAMLVATLLGAMLLYFGRLEKINALNWWGAAYLTGAAAGAIWLTFGAAFGGTLFHIVGSIGILACGLIWNAARVFHGRRPTWIAIAIGIAVWLLASAGIPAEALGTRLMVGAAIVALFAGLASGELSSERRRTMQRRWPALAVPILHGLVLLLPVLAGDIMSAETAVAQSRWATTFAIELVLYAIGTVFVIFLLVSERSMRAHKEAALTDPLTGLLNRRGFSEAAAKMMSQRAQAGAPVSLLVFDLDRFKSINDRFGHPTGDEVLKLFAATAVQTLRTNDLCGRLGGEEFAALLPCTVTEAVIAAERLREAFAASDIAIDDVVVETTVSVGVAGGPAGPDLGQLIATADAALYRAKAGGRNRTEVAQDNDLPGELQPQIARKPQIVVRGTPAAREIPV